METYHAEMNIKRDRFRVPVDLINIQFKTAFAVLHVVTIYIPTISTAYVHTVVTEISVSISFVFYAYFSKQKNIYTYFSFFELAR